MQKGESYSLYEIYLKRIITDSVMVEFMTTRYSSYDKFCTYMKQNLENNTITHKIMQRIHDISFRIQTCFGFETNESIQHVVDFFLDEKCYKEQYTLILTIIRTQGSYLF